MDAAELLALYKAGERDFNGLTLENLNLINFDLSGINLRDANLRNADLSGTDLSDANLSGANLSWINLSGADLSGANLRRTNLMDSDLSGADLSGADFTDADLKNANLSYAYLIGADLRNSDLNDAYLGDTDLTDADLRNANLSGVDFTDADLSGTDLTNTNLNFVNLDVAITDSETKLDYKWQTVYNNSIFGEIDSAYNHENFNDEDDNDIKLIIAGIDLKDNNINLSGVNLSSHNLSGTDLRNADLRNADLSDADLSNADLRGADLSGANLIGIDLRNADLSDANLSSANLNGANLDLAILTGTLIDNETKLDHKWYLVWELINKKSNLREEKYDQLSLSKFNSFDHDYRLCRDLSNSCLKKLDLTGLNLSFSILYGADCENTNFTNTNLYCANFHSADLRGADFTNADLRYAILIGANLRGADFTNADLRYINLHGVDLTYSKTEGAKFTTFDDISCSWNQLNDKKFEELSYDILIKQHNLKLTDIHKIGNSHSRDGGRDIVFYKGADINKKSIKWIAQCKFKSDKRSLGSSQVPNIRDMLDQYNAKGFCILTSGIIDATLHDRLDTLKEDKGFEVEKWSYLEIERFLAEHPEIKGRYFKD
ncbi:pentapeptide repeat-containing protein [Anabaena catenula]|uniref:Pentapeptide repeat-containing protein n=1 Tax=Anabaena catenula FACHB-362 TaxID=2692877 RepID=A0ABR8J0T6_9NOST|nr:pentapeptide repeat-containing protein [Anabaena catenula]MBD2691054.1 pentapeptide repeat-containing protein [Anabaena catenula FACHB-362]